MLLSREQLIAPCGLDCSLCYRFQRTKDACPGCRGDDRDKLKSCLNCKIKNCELIKNKEVDFCANCSQFPCKLVKNLDKRYKQSYRLSVINSLERIVEVGISQYVNEQDENWTCDSCGEKLCMHSEQCSGCGNKTVRGDDA